MKTLKLIQILFIASSFTACNGAKNRSKATGGKRAEVAKQTNAQTPMERKQNGRETPPLEPASPPPAMQPPKVAPAPSTATDAPAPAPSSSDKPAPATPAEPAVTTPEIAADTQEIKDAKGAAKINFKNLESLKKLSGHADSVIMDGASLSRDEAMKKLTSGSENHFCKLSGLDKFNSKDFLKLVATDRKSLDEENDLHNTKLTFENKNGRLDFDCVHTNKSFLVQELRINMKEYLTITDQNDAVENAADYVNPYKAKRSRTYFKLTQIEMLDKVKYSDEMKKGFTLVNGKAIDGDEAIKNVTEGKAQHACVVMEVKGQLDTKKMYALTRAPTMVKSREDSSVIVVSYAFRADRENGFVMYCNQTKTSTHDEIFKSLEGAIKFETLERKEYNKKTKELAQIQAEFQKAQEEKKQTSASSAK